jgi:hypothetical protein
VEECPSRKNIAICNKVQALTRALNGSFVLSCKSGKDRTSMAVTLEQGHVLRQNFGISQQQVFALFRMFIPFSVFRWMRSSIACDEMEHDVKIAAKTLGKRSIRSVRKFFNMIQRESVGEMLEITAKQSCGQFCH